jgi:hypothetical protein
MLDALRSDHRAIAAELDDPEALQNSDDGDAARERTVMDLVRHFVAEEQYLYPTVRERLPDGERLAHDGWTVDRDMERHLRQFEHPELTPDRLATAWTQLRTAFSTHVDRQEPLLEALAAACSPAELDELGDGVLGSEQLAPTRPRILAPSSPTANKVTSFIEGYIDKARDYYSRRGVDPDAPH